VLKWKLMLSTLPIVLLLLAVKLFLERVLGFEGLIDFSDVGIILTSGVFLIGFLLAGTMADYKEAEKLPADLSCTLETIEEIFVLAATDRPALDLSTSRRNKGLVDALQLHERGVRGHDPAQRGAAAARACRCRALRFACRAATADAATERKPH